MGTYSSCCWEGPAHLAPSMALLRILVFILREIERYQKDLNSEMIDLEAGTGSYSFKEGCFLQKTAAVVTSGERGLGGA